MKTFPMPLLLAALVSCAPLPPRTEEPPATSSVHWRIDDLESIGGWPTTITGDPRVIETAGGRAVAFDGDGDGLFLDVHPLEGAAAFTAEVVFRPDPAGSEEQRFVHLQEHGSEDRILFETRLTGDGRWFLDTFVHSRGENVGLYAEDHLHPLGRWHHAAIVVDGSTLRHYVDGALELSAPLRYEPQGAGRTSIGVRINRVHWYSGAIHELRWTPQALEPEEFTALDSASRLRGGESPKAAASPR